jgi:hypothetical protein
MFVLPFPPPLGGANIVHPRELRSLSAGSIALWRHWSAQWPSLRYQTGRSFLGADRLDGVAPQGVPRW